MLIVLIFWISIFSIAILEFMGLVSTVMAVWSIACLSICAMILYSLSISLYPRRVKYDDCTDIKWLFVYMILGIIALYYVVYYTASMMWGYTAGIYIASGFLLTGSSVCILRIWYIQIKFLHIIKCENCAGITTSRSIYTCSFRKYPSPRSNLMFPPLIEPLCALENPDGKCTSFIHKDKNS